MIPRLLVRVAEWLLLRTLPPGDAGASIFGDLVEELAAAGHTPAAGRAFARRAVSIAIRYGFRRRPVPDPADQHRGEPMGWEALVQDVKFAARALTRRPSFALIVIATIALGIGASTAIFSAVNAVLLRPLPYPHPDALVYLTEASNGNRMSLAYPNYTDMHARAQSYESLACSQGNAFTVLEPRPRRLDGRLVCWNFFDVLGVRPQIGRTFVAADDKAGAAPVVIISDRLWRQEFGGDSSILGRVVRMSEMNFTVAGVLPPGFSFMRPEDIYAPLGLTVTPDSGWLERGNHRGLSAIGRLKPGIDVRQAHAEAEQIAADLARAYPNTNTGSTARVSLLRDRIVESVRDTLVALMCAVGFLLLLACVNVANLLVARGAARQHELAIRVALGGSRWRLVQQLLAESTLLSVAGGALGILLASWLLRTLVMVAPPDVPRLAEVQLDRTSVLFAAAAAAICGFVFGAFPALQASSGRGAERLARASRSSAAVSPHRTRRILMVVEVALALVLLAGCGLMARTMIQLNGVDPGFRPDHVLTARIELTGERWTDDRLRAFYEQLMPKLSALPGVTRAAVTQSLPIEGSQWGSIFTVADKPVPPRAELEEAAFVPVTPGYFDTMGIRLIAGRPFDTRDSAAGAPVVIVNESLVRRLWPGENPIGKRLRQGWPESQHAWREVVAVVGDVKLEGVDRETPAQVFLPLAQEPVRSAAIVVRTAGDPAAAAASVEAVVQSIDRDVPLQTVKPMTEWMRGAIARQRLSTVVLTMFAGLAILVAAVGLYGIVSHSVTERTREIGVRMALGAERREVLRLFVTQGVITAAAGVVIGLAGAAVLSRTLQTLLFGVTPSDPLTLGGVSALLLAVAAIACYIPARRAARIDPLRALRTD